MANLTLYIKEEDYPVIKRALKLMRFHEDESISSFVTKKCKDIVKKYDK